MVEGRVMDDALLPILVNNEHCCCLELSEERLRQNFRRQYGRFNWRILLLAAAVLPSSDHCH